MTAHKMEGAWSEEYRSHRYLRDVSDDEVRQRGRDVFRNFMTINVEGKASPLPAEHERHNYWRMRLVHFLEECAIRFGPYPSGLGLEFTDNLKFPNPNSERIARARKLCFTHKLVYGKYLVKYGKLEHLTSLLKDGVVRISPASVFADISFNDAIQDTELAFTRYVYQPSYSDLKPHFSETALRSYIPHATAVITNTSKSDFYLFCLSASYDIRLYDDFDAEACILITDPVTFANRLLWTVRSELDTSGHSFCPVDYIDPFTETASGIHVAHRKHARYAYQDELRAAWLPKAKSIPLRVHFVTLGNLEDIAKLILLK